MTESTADAARRPSYFDSVAARPRNGLDTASAPPLPAGSPGQSLPGTPRGQLGRPLSGTWNSPGGNFRQDDEVIVVELGARFLRVGLGGEASPRARMSFGPATQTRPGDYTAWLPGADSLPASHRARPDADDVGDWGAAHELYAPDVRRLDVQLLSLRLERSMRDASTAHVLAVDDSKRRAVALAVQPQLPQPVLGAALATLFAHFPSPAQIALLSTAVCSTVGAGLRSALVVDIGWRETLVSAVYELRELAHRRSERAMRRLNWAVARLLVERLDAQAGEETPGATFDDSEEVVWRMCHAGKKQHEPGVNIDVALASQPAGHALSMPFSDFARPVESVFFDDSGPADDNLTPLPLLLYHTLLRLPPDVRGALMSRVVVTGGGAHIPRLKARLLSDLADIIRRRGWDPVQSYGSAKKVRWANVALRTGPIARSAEGPGTSDESSAGEEDPSTATTTPEPRDEDDSSTQPQPTSESASPTKDDPPTNEDTNKPDDADPSTRSQPTPDPEATMKDTTTPATKSTPPTNKDIDPTSSTPAAHQPPLPDEILAKLQRANAPITSSGTHPFSTTGAHTQPHPSTAHPPTQGATLRALRTVGAWSGASLLSGLRQRGVVEIERDAFLAHGLAGADRGGGGAAGEEIGAVVGVQRRQREREHEKRQSVFAGGRGGASGGGDRQSGSWTLGAWA